MSLLVKTITLILMLCLSGCGFTPLYGEPSESAKEQIGAGFDQIFIENIPDREGQYLRNALIDRFYSAGRPDAASYRLYIEPIAERKTDLDITKSSDATRAQMRLSTEMILSDRVSGRNLLRRKLVSITSYNILQSHFTTQVSEQNARRNALDDLARQVEQQLALYFKRAQ